MNKDLPKILWLPTLILLIAGIGCGREDENTSAMPLALGPEIPKEVNFKGIDFVDPENGISFKHYPHYKCVHRDDRGIILREEGGQGRIVVFIWPLDADTYMWYVDAFGEPLTLKRRLQRELKVKEKIISYRVLEKEEAEAFLFTTQTPQGLYIQRIELFPKERPLQISLFFWHEKKDEPEVLNMIGSIKILKTKEQKKPRS